MNSLSFPSCVWSCCLKPLSDHMKWKPFMVQCFHTFSERVFFISIIITIVLKLCQTTGCWQCFAGRSMSIAYVRFFIQAEVWWTAPFVRSRRYSTRHHWSVSVPRSPGRPRKCQPSPLILPLINRDSKQWTGPANHTAHHTLGWKDAEEAGSCREEGCPDNWSTQ